MTSKLIEKTLESKYIYQGKVINLRYDKVLLPNHKKGYREIIEHRGGVGILAFTKEHKLILIKQYRHAYQDIILEIPAGKIDVNEKPLDTAFRELNEEVGGSVNSLELLHQMYPSVGYTNEIIYLYLALDVKLDNQKLDPDEFLEVVLLDFNQAYEMVKTNEIKDAKTSLAILMYWSWKNAKGNDFKSGS